MAQNTRQHIDVKVKIYEYPVIPVKRFKSYVQIMADFPLPFATKMDTQIGV